MCLRKHKNPLPFAESVYLEYKKPFLFYCNNSFSKNIRQDNRCCLQRLFLKSRALKT